MVLLKTTGQCEHLAPTNQSLNIDDRSTDHQPVRNLRTKKIFKSNIYTKYGSKT